MAPVGAVYSGNLMLVDQLLENNVNQRMISCLTLRSDFVFVGGGRVWRARSRQSFDPWFLAWDGLWDVRQYA